MNRHEVVERMRTAFADVQREVTAALPQLAFAQNDFAIIAEGSWGEVRGGWNRLPRNTVNTTDTPYRHGDTLNTFGPPSKEKS